MPDVFISYNHLDRDRVALIADELISRGLDVWWDIRVNPGAEFQRRIESEARASRCLIVVWTNASLNSDWVRAEAMLGFDLKTLISVRFDDVVIPLPFNIQDVVDLAFWPDGNSQSEMGRLVHRATELTRSEVPAGAAVTAKPDPGQNLSVRLARRVAQAIQKPPLPMRTARLERMLPAEHQRRFIQATGLYNQFELDALLAANEILGKLSGEVVGLFDVELLQSQLLGHLALLTWDQNYVTALASAQDGSQDLRLKQLAGQELVSIEEALYRDLLEPDDQCLLRYALFLLIPLGLADPAISFLTAAEKANPLSAEIRFHLARSLFHAGKDMKALEKLDEALQIAPRAGLVWLFRCLIAHHRGYRLESAEVVSNQALPVDHPLLKEYQLVLNGQQPASDLLARLDALLNNILALGRLGLLTKADDDNAAKLIDTPQIRATEWYTSLAEKVHLYCDQVL